MYSEQLNSAIKYAQENNSFNKVNEVVQAKNVCVFGLGNYFKENFIAQKVKEKYHVNLLCDNNPDSWDKEIFGLKCVNPESLKEYDDIIVIIMINNPVPVEEQLRQMGIRFVSYINLFFDFTMECQKDPEWFMNKESEIKSVLEMFSDEESKKVYVNGLCNRIAPKFSKYNWHELYNDEGQYFNQNFLKLNTGEYYVDCGAYIGDTVMEFIDKINDFKKISAFELDGNNFKQMQENLKDYTGDIKLYNYGVWSENKELDYGLGGSEKETPAGISIFKTEDLVNNVIQKAEVRKLDDILKDEMVTFIKMDVEGAEIDAILGAETIIRQQKPKLAICVYHKTSDFWEVPLLLKKLNKDYQFALRHNCKTDCTETVLYAI